MGLGVNSRKYGTENRRLPYPVFVEHPNGRVTVKCLSCPLSFGRVLREQAEAWAKRHRCSNWGYSIAGGLLSGTRQQVID